MTTDVCACHDHGDNRYFYHVPLQNNWEVVIEYDSPAVVPVDPGAKCAVEEEDNETKFYAYIAIYISVMHYINHMNSPTCTHLSMKPSFNKWGK